MLKGSPKMVAGCLQQRGAANCSKAGIDAAVASICT